MNPVPFKKTLARLKKGWLAVSLLLSALILVPLVIVVSGLFAVNEQSSKVIGASFSSQDVINTFILVFFTVIFTGVIGVSCAWVVTQYRFPLRKFFSWTLLLPIAIPGYILAFTYAGIFSFTGSYHSLLSAAGVEDHKAWHFDIMTFPFLIAVLSLSLFPYVYITSKTAFSSRYASYIEAARSMGKSSSRIFFFIALRLAWPAIAAGLFLVVMETLNDYGASSYFGIRTLTLAIFRAWQYDLGAALWIASVLFCTVFVFMGIEKLTRGKTRYNENTRSVSLRPEKLKGMKSLLAFLVCAIPFLFAFLIPFLQLAYWSYVTFGKVVTKEFLVMAYNSLALAFQASVVVVITALLFYQARHINRIKIFTGLSTIGYAIPGAVIGAGVLAVCGFADRFIAENITHERGLIFTGSIFVMIYAYTVRFLAVGYQPVESAYAKMSSRLTESARSLGAGRFKTLLRIELPVIKTSIVAALLLVFVDVLKELPLTMILRPFNFETLATESYRYAKVMESVPESANAALIIVLFGMIPVFLLNRIMK